MEGWGCRDVKEEEETTPWAEQQSWEAEQIKKASMRVGSKDKKKKEYDLVFEDQIDFIMDQVATGENLEVHMYIALHVPPHLLAPFDLPSWLRIKEISQRLLHCILIHLCMLGRHDVSANVEAIPAVDLLMDAQVEWRALQGVQVAYSVCACWEHIFALQVYVAGC
jgi:hypothetical protein